MGGGKIKVLTFFVVFFVAKFSFIRISYYLCIAESVSCKETEIFLVASRNSGAFDC